MENFHQKLKQIVEKINFMESKRIKFGKFLRKINHDFKIGPNEEILDTQIINKVPDSTFKKISVLGVDGGIVKHSYHGLDLMLMRAVGVNFIYSNNSLEKVFYYPSSSPFPNPRSKGIDMEAELKEVKKITKQFDMIFTPIKKGKIESPWMIISQKGYTAIQKVLGRSQYIAQEGINTRGANAVFYINILDKQHDLFLIKNNRDEGRKKYKESKRLVENKLIFPLIRGNEVKRWYAKSRDYILVPHNEKTGNVIPGN